MNGFASDSVTVRLRLVTPAFLGGADQSAELRSAPFKALLRQYWRIANAKAIQYDHETLRQQEGILFGHAWLKTSSGGGMSADKPWHMKSPIVVAVQPVNGKICLFDSWPKDPKIPHPEVNFPIGAHLYLGYGPLDYDKAAKRTVLKNNRKALADNSEFKVRISGRKMSELRSSLGAILALWHWIGCIGGRSRNGWGSIEILDVRGMNFSQAGPAQDLASVAGEYDICLQRAWPHSVGTDSKGLLCWRTKDSYSSWKEAMENLAQIKVHLRTSFKFPQGQAKKFSDRHFLAYPVTNHSVAEWSSETRLANQLRLKVLKSGSDYLGALFHVPAGLPPFMAQKLKDPNIELRKKEREVWQKVHEILDREAVRWK